MFDSVARVYELAAEAGMTITELCRRAEINYSTLSTACRRGTQLSVDTILFFCKALEISPAEFFATAGEPQRGMQGRRKPGAESRAGGKTA